MKLGVFMVPCWLVYVREVKMLFLYNVLRPKEMCRTVVTKSFIFQRAAGQSIYDKLKMFPPLASPSAHVVLRPNAKVITSNSTSMWTTVLDFAKNCDL